MGRGMGPGIDIDGQPQQKGNTYELTQISRGQFSLLKSSCAYTHTYTHIHKYTHKIRWCANRHPMGPPLGPRRFHCILRLCNTIRPETTRATHSPVQCCAPESSKNTNFV